MKNRRTFLKGAGAFALLAPRLAREAGAFQIEESTIADLQGAMRSGRETARSLVEGYLARIDEVDRRGPRINSVIETNPDALAIAEKLDEERRAGRLRGPLHGIPIALKDNGHRGCANHRRERGVR